MALIRQLRKLYLLYVTRRHRALRPTSFLLTLIFCWLAQQLLNHVLPHLTLRRVVMPWEPVYHGDVDVTFAIEDASSLMARLERTSTVVKRHDDESCDGHSETFVTISVASNPNEVSIRRDGKGGCHVRSAVAMKWSAQC